MFGSETSIEHNATLSLQTETELVSGFIMSWFGGFRDIRQEVLRRRF